MSRKCILLKGIKRPLMGGHMDLGKINKVFNVLVPGDD